MLSIDPVMSSIAFFPSSTGVKDQVLDLVVRSPLPSWIWKTVTAFLCSLWHWHFENRVSPSPPFLKIQCSSSWVCLVISPILRFGPCILRRNANSDCVSWTENHIWRHTLSICPSLTTCSRCCPISPLCNYWFPLLATNKNIWEGT